MDILSHISQLDQPNPTHYKMKNLNPAQPDPIKPIDEPNPRLSLP